MTMRDKIETLKYDMKVFLEQAYHYSNSEKIEKLETFSARLNFIIMCSEESQKEKKKLTDFFKIVRLSLN